MQQDLERTTEHLSELTEQPVDHIDRMELINYSQATRKVSLFLPYRVEANLPTCGAVASSFCTTSCAVSKTA